MKKFIAMAAISLLVLAGCATSSDESEAPEVATPTTSETVEVTEHEIVVGETFTMDSPHYVAHITVTDVFRPESCGEVPYSDGLEYDTFVGVETDVEVESGDGEGSVPNGVNERTEDGYLQKNRSIAAVTCEGYEELSATRVQTGEKYNGVLWLQEDVDPSSEIILEPHVSAGEPVVTEVFVLDLAKFDLLGDAEEAEPTETPAQEPASEETAPAAAPATASGPTFVNCYLADGTALMSDGSHVYMDRCHENAGRPGFDSGQAREWSECVIDNGQDYCARQYAPSASTPQQNDPLPEGFDRDPSGALIRPPAVEAEKQAGHDWWGECIAANTAEVCRANDPSQN